MSDRRPEITSTHDIHIAIPTGLVRATTALPPNQGDPYSTLAYLAIAVMCVAQQDTGDIIGCPRRERGFFETRYLATQ